MLRKALGNGNHLGSVYAKITGASNKRGNLSSSPDTIGWMSYRGIENFYAEAWEWVDGVNVKDREVFVNGDYTTFASDVFTPPYVSTGKSLPASSYIKDMYFDISGIIPTLGGGTSATYITDYVYSAATTDNVMAFGGMRYGLFCGASCFMRIPSAMLCDMALESLSKHNYNRNEGSEVCVYRVKIINILH